MKTVKGFLVSACALSILFSSCQKDAIVSEQSSVSGVSTADATADDEIETAPPVWTSVATNVNSNVAGYWQGVPAKYSSTTKKYPLIVFIHGIGELGTSLSRMNCCGLPRHMYNKTFPANFNINGKNYSFLVIAPQFKLRPSAAQVQSVVEYAKRRWRVDEARVYVTGLSMGGGSTWDWSAVYGENAAAIVPVCGGTKPSTTMTTNIASKNLPIWGLYSTADAVVPVQWGRDFFSWIDSRNTAFSSKTKLTIWTDANHNATWQRAFNPATKVDGFNIYQWMLLYTRGTSNSGTPTPAPTTPVPAPAPTPVDTANSPAPTPDPTPAPKPEPTTPVNPTPGNQLPIAKAGEDRIIPLSWNYMPTIWGNTSIDPDGKIVSYRWTKISGPSSYTINNPTGNYTKLTNLVAGQYVFRLTVTDNKGGVSTDDIVITMTSSSYTGTIPPVSGGNTSNALPVANAGADRSIPLSWNYDPTIWGNTSKDSDGYIVAFKWTKVSGPSSYTLQTPNANYTKITNLVAGTYVFRLTVTDNKGGTSTDDVTITMTK